MLPPFVNLPISAPPSKRTLDEVSGEEDEDRIEEKYFDKQNLHLHVRVVLHETSKFTRILVAPFVLFANATEHEELDVTHTAQVFDRFPDVKNSVHEMIDAVVAVLQKRDTITRLDGDWRYFEFVDYISDLKDLIGTLVPSFRRIQLQEGDDKVYDLAPELANMNLFTDTDSGFPDDSLHVKIAVFEHTKEQGYQHVWNRVKIGMQRSRFVKEEALSRVLRNRAGVAAESMVYSLRA